MKPIKITIKAYEPLSLIISYDDGSFVEYHASPSPIDGSMFVKSFDLTEVT